METDRELLLLAAKAAGFDKVEYQEGDWMEVRYGVTCAIWNGTAYWNPLEDDGDALRLAVKLGIIVCVDYEIGICGIHLPGCRGKYDLAEELGDAPYAATRLAITRAAASIAKDAEREGK